MKTAELPIGAHVAYDRNHSRSYPSFGEAFVIAHRPKGTKSNYWGARTGNSDTIGLAYWNGYVKDEKGQPIWQFSWTRPQDIHMTWDEHQKAVSASKKRDAEISRNRLAAQADRQVRWDSLPADVRALFTDWRIESLIERGDTTMGVSIDLIEKIIAAGVAADPRLRAEKVASEVEAALNLLG